MLALFLFFGHFSVLPGLRGFVAVIRPIDNIGIALQCLNLERLDTLHNAYHSWLASAPLIPPTERFILFAGNGFQVEDALLRLVSLYLSVMSCRIFASFVTFKYLCLNQFLGRLWTISS